ncbi:nickel-dependent hydrogenase large subunit [Methanospirillum stamsii]|uniref:NADH-quinone oxidoreductase subunit D n=1 Tax=Methanospirillum stamsii TaxID=1277351 RepID=A0A2V2N9S4_9EURY|nr:nickel-dependent hydrogenase large subunit [Methanospirillum stamsii]PWR72361.1 NADH-quinone oxidoreductase subunit D [Methanospirillum stamsii]
MSKKIIVPFGPQHPVLPEPIHLDLVLEDERVIEAIPSIGYVHRGLEKLVEKRDYKDYVFISERICGICSFIHGATYCQAVEQVMGVEIPRRAEFLRAIWSEYSRMHSHLLWLGCFADSMGYENLFMDCWKVREKILDVLERTTGGRVIQGVNRVGGVSRDMDKEELNRIKSEIPGLRADYVELTRIFDEDLTVQSRTKGIGMLPKDTAWELGAVGPTIRGSGHAVDARMTGYGAYDELDFKPVVRTEGDCHARCMVRTGELFTSLDLIENAIDRIPEGDIIVPVKGNPSGEYYAQTEQPRGEVIHYVKANGKKNLLRHRVRTPTLANVPALVQMLAGCELADVPVIVLTIDPCIGCMER